MSALEGNDSPEKLRFSTETITGKAFLEQIRVDGESDPRFVPIEQGGVFYFSPLGFFSEIKEEGVYYSLLKLNDLVVGIAQEQESPIEPGVLWFKSVCIDENLKGQYYSERLLREVFRFAKSKDMKLQLSSYTEEGAERLQHKISDLAQEFNVALLDKLGNPLQS